MDDLTDEEFNAASARGREHFLTEPHARSARYDRDAAMVILDLYSGCTFAFPPRQLQGLADATDAQLAEVELSPTGFGVHWEALDADFSVPGLLAGRFGNAKYMAAFRERLAASLDEMLSERHAAD